MPCQGLADARGYPLSFLIEHACTPSPEVDRLIVAMRKPEWVGPNCRFYLPCHAITLGVELDEAAVEKYEKAK